MTEGAVLLDVRTKEEYAKEHIKGAINIPYSKIKKEKKLLEQLIKNKKNKIIVVYCRTGRRSAIAKNILNKMGYSNVINHGGINTWKKVKETKTILKTK